MSFPVIFLAAAAAAAEPSVSPDTAPAPAPAVPVVLQAPPAVSSQSPAVSVQSDEQGGIVVSASKAPREDPLQNVNLQSFEVVQSVDKAFVGPVAHAYEHGLPSPVRGAVHNVLTELEEPTVFVNFLLQHKVGKATETLGRFVINATLGLGGLIDVAKKKPFNLPHRRNGFAYTMGFYGIKSGPYLYLPLIGSTSLRDVTGRILDLSLVPFAVGKPFKGIYYMLGKGALSAIDDRVELDAVLERLRSESADPYGDLRRYYLEKRQREIDALHGKTFAEPYTITITPLVSVPAASGETPPR